MTPQGAHGIAWTDWSSNPLRYRDAAGHVVWACAKVSRGCTNCYAEAFALRYDKGGPFNAGTVGALTPFLDKKEMNALRTSTKIRGKRVFIGDMTDVFGEWVPDALLDELWDVFDDRPDVTFQVLTKRADRMERATQHWVKLPNVWLGVSAEDQAAADERVPHLLRARAAVRFVSYEPALGPLNLREMAHRDDFHIDALDTPDPSCRVDWVIVGGESGQGAREFDVAWALSMIEQCQRAGTAVFVKQLGTRPAALQPGLLSHGTVPLGLSDRKGGDPEEWHTILRVREFPDTRARRS